MGIHTLHIEHVVLLGVYTLLTVANSLLYREMKGIHWFSLYNLFALLGAICVAMRGQIPDFASIVLGNLFVVAGYSLFSFSLAAMLGIKRSHLYVQAALFGVAVATMLQYGWLHQDTKARLIAYSVVLGLQQTQIALFVSRKRGGGLRVDGGPMALILAALALTNVVRIVGVSVHGAPANYLNAGAFLGWIVIINTCLQCGVMVAYVWMTAALLRSDLEVQASTDPLTGLLNRRAFVQRAEEQITACRAAAKEVSAITIDLDDFKAINDTYGHSCGDSTLILVADCLRRHVREHDLLARLGGDEFAVLLPQTMIETAQEIAERLRASLEELRVADGSFQTRVTASIGIAKVDGRGLNWDGLILGCDQALYAAKRTGGNRVVQEASLASAESVVV